jgi:hypothetical protein
MQPRNLFVPSRLQLLWSLALTFFLLHSSFFFCSFLSGIARRTTSTPLNGRANTRRPKADLRVCSGWQLIACGLRCASAGTAAVVSFSSLQLCVDERARVRLMAAG